LRKKVPKNATGILYISLPPQAKVIVHMISSGKKVLFNIFVLIVLLAASIFTLSSIANALFAAPAPQQAAYGSVDDGNFDGGAIPDADGQAEVSQTTETAARSARQTEVAGSSFNTTITLSEQFFSLPDATMPASASGVALNARFSPDEVIGPAEPDGTGDNGVNQANPDNSDDKLAQPAGLEDDAERKKAYLTFDDGPTQITEQVLETLNARGVRATFFVIGANVKKNPDIVREAYESGHLIANHSYSHNYDKVYQSLSSLKSEIKKCDDAINAALGFSYDSRIFRFPGGSSEAPKYRKEIAKIGYKYYDWDCLNGDSQLKNKTPEKLFDHMLGTFKNQDELIVLMHDSLGKQTTVDMLNMAIDFFIEKGYDFYTLDEK